MPKMAVITPFGLCEFLRMPFGLKNAAQVFQRLMESVLRDLTFLFIYLDNILIASDCKEEHLSHPQILFDCLNQHGLIVNPVKCRFVLPSINFLGHHITKDGAIPLPSKIAELWSACQQRHLTYISEFTMDVQHVAGKSDVVRAMVNAVHLGIDYARLASDQASDPEVQTYRTASTSLQLADVSFDGAGASLLCDISTELLTATDTGT
ncbi:hypothetical protein AAFF_G00234470 [Aldrovandia affinis]|uniref:ribonuclease H n=1 Tax=Aldrovandia affinis TaxID=143900 RepID=A0AAD7SUV5_9TELE|nr:hypothetical protein AAFF_G00234470 [Aldrovandia affinis]